MPTLQNLVLLPRPRHITPLPGVCNAAHSTPRTEIRSGNGIPAQGYRFRISKKGVAITASDAAGAFYGAMTLRQIQRQCNGALPACEIEDHPDFPARGVLLYISGGKVPTMETLFALIDDLAEWKINHLELGIEHTFAYRNHRKVWARASPMTHMEIRKLDAYCRERFIELVPHQQSFGHLARWLELPRYRKLAEDPKKPFGLCPTDPNSPMISATLISRKVRHLKKMDFHPTTILCCSCWFFTPKTTRFSVAS